MRIHLKTLAVAASMVAATGCYSTWDVPAKSLESLNGFREPDKRVIVDANGEEFAFDHSTELRFMRSSGEAAAAKFSTIAVSGPEFSGATRPQGAPLAINLNEVLGVRAKKFSTLKTVLAIAIPLGVLTVASIVILAAAASSGGGGSYCDPYYGC